MTVCPDRNALNAFAIGIGTPVKLDDIAAHLDTCASCQRMLETLKSPVDPVVAAVQSDGVPSPYIAEAECREALSAIAQICPAPVSTPAGAVGDVPPLELIREYELLEKIGAGGMGTVYRARHTHLNRIVALKVLLADRMPDPQAAARFRREMEAVGQLDHPNIVRAFDAGQHGPTQYLVLEYVDGIDLSTWSHLCGRAAVADACEVIRQTALGLEYAHARQLVHRDMKPSNLLLTKDGQVKILDFGLALLRADHSLQAELTGTGQVMGTPDYMAPEQIADTHGVDIRADLYSLGCTLFKLLTGATPFDGPQYKTPYQKMLGHVQAAPPSIAKLRADVPPTLAVLIGRLLSKAPAERPDSPADLAAAIAPFTVGANLSRMLAQAKSIDEATKIGPSQSSESTAVRSHSVETGGAARLPAVPSLQESAGAVPSSRSAPLAPRPLARRARWALLSTAGALLLAAVVTITTKEGTVTITQPEDVGDHVEIVLCERGEEVAILDKSNHWTVNVRNGDYSVAVRGGSDQFRVKGNKLTVRRLGQTLVEVEAIPTAVKATVEPSAPELPGVLNSKAVEEMQATLQKAFQGKVTVHSNGHVEFFYDFSDPKQLDDWIVREPQSEWSVEEGWLKSKKLASKNASDTRLYHRAHFTGRHREIHYDAQGTYDLDGILFADLVNWREGYSVRVAGLGVGEEHVGFHYAVRSGSNDQPDGQKLGFTRVGPLVPGKTYRVDAIAEGPEVSLAFNGEILSSGTIAPEFLQTGQMTCLKLGNSHGKFSNVRVVGALDQQWYAELQRSAAIPSTGPSMSIFRWPADALREGRVPAPDLSKARVLFKDEFDNPKSGWPQGKRENPFREFGYHEGKYFVRFTGPRSFRGERFQTPFKDLTEFACEIVGRADISATKWGLHIVDVERKSGISLCVQTDGTLEIWPGWDGYQGPPTTVINHPVIKKGPEFNRLLAVVRNQRVEVYVNGEAVCDPITMPAAFTPADLQLSFHSWKDAQSEFERITVWSVEGLPTPEERLEKGEATFRNP